MTEQGVVFSKMLELLRTDDELAAVLAHEVGHVLARHAVRRPIPCTTLAAMPRRV